MNLVCLLEEKSAEEMLKVILPKVLPEDVHVRTFAFEGKQDLEKKLKRRIQHWQEPDSFFLVMRDQDSGNCLDVKKRLKTIIAETGKAEQTLVRIACHELESFYLGDLRAVESGLAINNLSRRQQENKFRTPDTLANAAEELIKLTGKKYQKISGSRSIAPFMTLDNSNRSTSFNTLVRGIKTLLGVPA